MQVVADRNALHRLLAEVRSSGRRIALVATMGSLHRGHLSLVHRAAECADFVLTSIYVNPMQFAAGEDLAEYPRSLDADLEALGETPCDAVFTPDDATMYPSEGRTRIEVPLLAERFCGADRPLFFPGICQVVVRLFNLIRPDAAVFGCKDLQQLRIIEQLCTDLAFPIEIIAAPTVREADGLAMSSRNAYLSDFERERAPMLYRTLKECTEQIQSGRPLRQVLDTASADLGVQGFSVRYLGAARWDDLREPSPGDAPVALLACAVLGQTRLIDNIVVEAGLPH
ncbi:MAG: pantoate--beta-alanine ligase [Gammaproteobacteria bacterium AqS3]|nr:pantoate--beta-alanine ligase [Gammaproteobacteria bacterium AqS3]